jgi:hypothetical protein
MSSSEHSAPHSTAAWDLLERTVFFFQKFQVAFDHIQPWHNQEGNLADILGG